MHREKFYAEAACIKEIADAFEGEDTCCFLFYVTENDSVMLMFLLHKKYSARMHLAR